MSAAVPPPAPAALAARLLGLYPAPASLPAAMRDEALALDARSMQMSTGTLVFDEGRPCQGFPMVLSGELCVVSITGLFGQSLLVAHGSATQDCELVVLSPQAWY